MSDYTPPKFCPLCDEPTSLCQCPQQRSDKVTKAQSVNKRSQEAAAALQKRRVKDLKPTDCGDYDAESIGDWAYDDFLAGYAEGARAERERIYQLLRGWAINLFQDERYEEFEREFFNPPKEQGE